MSCEYCEIPHGAKLRCSIGYSKDHWWCDITDYDDAVEVKYCPMCGRKMGGE